MCASCAQSGRSYANRASGLMTDKELAKSLSVCQGRGRRARAALDVPARECRIARHYVWACLPRILSLLPSTEVQCAEVCVRADGVTKWLQFYWLNFWTSISRRLFGREATFLSSA